MAVLASIVLLSAGPVRAQLQPHAPERALKALTYVQDDYPDISPDGRHIVFQSNRSGTWQLWIMNRDGTGLRRLTRTGANDRTPAWSPDGARILFSSDRGSSTGDNPGQAPSSPVSNIFVMDVSAGLDGAEERAVRLVEHAGQDIHPKWAPGGRAIVFNRVYSTRDGADVMIVDADGRNLRRVALDRGWNTLASFTPDGSRLVYRGTTPDRRGGRPVENSDIFSAASDGSARVRLTDDPAFDGWPSVSPDGTMIAFASRRGGTRYHVYLMPLAGGAARQITFGDTYNYTQPAWAPDGRHLAAYRWTQDETAEIGHIVWIDLEASAD